MRLLILKENYHMLDQLPYSLEKVLMITPSYLPNLGGVERHVFNITRELSHEYQIDLLVTRRERDEKVINYRDHINKIFNINLIKMRYMNYFYLPFRSILLLPKFLNYKIIHVHDFSLFYLLILPVLPFLKIFGTKVFITFHGWEGRFPPKKIIIFLRIMAEKLSYRSILVGDFIQKWYLASKNAIVTYGGVKGTYDRKIDALSIRENKIQNHFALFGRLEIDSNCTFLINLFIDLAIENPSLSLTVLGDGSLKKSLIDKVKEAQIYNRVRFLGFINDPSPFLLKSKYIFTSGYLGILESLHAGAFVISSYDNPLKKDYLDGINLILNRNVLILNEDDFEQSIDNLRCFLSTTQSHEFNKFGKEIADTYTWKACSLNYKALWG